MGGLVLATTILSSSWPYTPANSIAQLDNNDDNDNDNDDGEEEQNDGNDDELGDYDNDDDNKKFLQEPNCAPSLCVQLSHRWKCKLTMMTMMLMMLVLMMFSR